eukprot:s3411_g3.t1
MATFRALQGNKEFMELLSDMSSKGAKMDNKTNSTASEASRVSTGDESHGEGKDDVSKMLLRPDAGKLLKSLSTDAMDIDGEPVASTVASMPPPPQVPMKKSAALSAAAANLDSYLDSVYGGSHRQSPKKRGDDSPLSDTLPSAAAGDVPSNTAAAAVSESSTSAAAVSETNTSAAAAVTETNTSAAAEESETNTSAAAAVMESITSAAAEESETNTSAAAAVMESITSAAAEESETNTSAAAAVSESKTHAAAAVTESNTSAAAEESETNTSLVSSTTAIAPDMQQYDQDKVGLPKVPGVPRTQVLIKTATGIQIPAVLNMTAEQARAAGLIVLDATLPPGALTVPPALKEEPMVGPSSVEKHLDGLAKDEPEQAAMVKDEQQKLKDECAEAARQEKKAQFDKLSNDRAGRQQMFEEFLQCSGDWLQSSIYANAKTFEKNLKRGVYKLMSREDVF